MAAVRALIRGEVRPVGQPVHLCRSPAPLPEFSGYTSLWAASGTTALAVAVAVAISRRPSVVRPKVLLPAYGCPDLVSATVHAGATPVLVDVGTDDPGFDIDRLATLCGADVAAIVAVDFLGVRERLADVRRVADAHGALLIEDRAQAFPENAADLVGDAVVLSFGRGKPVNLLGGGAVLLREELAVACADDPLPGALMKGGGATAPTRLSLTMFELQAAAFNLLLRPIPYYFLARLPGAEVGATRYRRLQDVQAMDGRRLRYLGCGVAAWRARSRWREQRWRDCLRPFADFVRLPDALEGRVGRLLRYPALLPDRSSRDRVIAALKRHGLGASRFYGDPLPFVEGVPEAVAVQGPFPEARRFADRLVLLPLHDGVMEAHIDRAGRVVANVLSRSA